MIAALFVQTNGVYFGLPDVDPWDEKRDARKYAGPWPVVAHPPCSRWCRLAGLVEARWGYMRGDDGGCFKSALENVRKYGGVLEHPAYSDAWKAFGINQPATGANWAPCDYFGGKSCHVEQGRYGHVAKKATWLYACGISIDDLPNLRWGSDPDSKSKAPVSWCANYVKSGETRPRVGRAAASRSPIEMRDILIGIARASSPRIEAAG